MRELKDAHGGSATDDADETSDNRSSGNVILRRGADVTATDGPFGTLVDVVADPVINELTHLVIAPDGELQQARVVPIWLTNETEEGIRVELDSRHVKQLQRSLPDDYVRRSPSRKFPEHDLRLKSVLYHPYFVDPAHPHDPTVDGPGFALEELDVRCGSDVISTNDRLLGQVVGFLIADERVHALVVRSGLTGFTHDVVVPTAAIAEIVADMVLLDIDRHEFRRLPTTSVIGTTRTRGSRVDFVKNSTARAWYSTRDRLRATLAD